MWWDAMRSPAARWNHPKAVEKTVPWKPWKTKPRFPTAPTAPWKTRNLGQFPTFQPPCDSLFPSRKKTKGQEGSMNQADKSSVNKSGQIQKLPTWNQPAFAVNLSHFFTDVDYAMMRRLHSLSSAMGIGFHGFFGMQWRRKNLQGWGFYEQVTILGETA